MKVEVTAHSTHGGFFAAGQDNHCSIHRNTVLRLAHTYRSPLFFCDLEVRTLDTHVRGKDSQHTGVVSGMLLGGSPSTK